MSFERDVREFADEARAWVPRWINVEHFVTMVTRVVDGDAAAERSVLDVPRVRIDANVVDRFAASGPRMIGAIARRELSLREAYTYIGLVVEVDVAVVDGERLVRALERATAFADAVRTRERVRDAPDALAVVAAAVRAGGDASSSRAREFAWFAAAIGAVYAFLASLLSVAHVRWAQGAQVFADGTRGSTIGALAVGAAGVGLHGPTFAQRFATGYVSRDGRVVPPYWLVPVVYAGRALGTIAAVERLRSFAADNVQAAPLASLAAAVLIGVAAVHTTYVVARANETLVFRDAPRDEDARDLAAVEDALERERNDAARRVERVDATLDALAQRIDAALAESREQRAAVERLVRLHERVDRLRVSNVADTITAVDDDDVIEASDTRAINDVVERIAKRAVASALERSFEASDMRRRVLELVNEQAIAALVAQLRTAAADVRAATGPMARAVDALRDATIDDVDQVFDVRVTVEAKPPDHAFAGVGSALGYMLYVNDEREPRYPRADARTVLRVRADAIIVWEVRTRGHPLYWTRADERVGTRGAGRLDNVRNTEGERVVNRGIERGAVAMRVDDRDEFSYQCWSHESMGGGIIAIERGGVVERTGVSLYDARYSSDDNGARARALLALEALLAGSIEPVSAIGDVASLDDIERALDANGPRELAVFVHNVRNELRDVVDALVRGSERVPHVERALASLPSATLRATLNVDDVTWFVRVGVDVALVDAAFRALGGGASLRNRALLEAADADNVDVIEWLAAAAGDLGNPTAALMRAVRADAVRAVRALLRAGNVDANANGNALLREALHHLAPRVIRALGAATPDRTNADDLALLQGLQRIRVHRMQSLRNGARAGADDLVSEERTADALDAAFALGSIDANVGVLAPRLIEVDRFDALARLVLRAAGDEAEPEWPRDASLFDEANAAVAPVVARVLGGDDANQRFYELVEAAAASLSVRAVHVVRKLALDANATIVFDEALAVDEGVELDEFVARQTFAVAFELVHTPAARPQAVARAIEFLAGVADRGHVSPNRYVAQLATHANDVDDDDERVQRFSHELVVAMRDRASRIRAILALLPGGRALVDQYDAECAAGGRASTKRQRTRALVTSKSAKK